MKVVCSWCQSEGKAGYLGEIRPFDDPSATYGVCSRHRERLLESLPSPSFPEADLLIVVRANETRLYEHLQRTLGGLRGVKVIMERRRAERRRQEHAPADERRRERRRLRHGAVFSMGYVLVRFRRR